MKKILIVLTSLVAVLTLGVVAAYAGEFPTYTSSDNNIGILLYDAAHPAGVEMAVAGRALVPGVIYGSDLPGFSSGDNNIGILLAKGAEGAVEGSGAGGMISREEMGTWKSFAEVHPFVVTLTPKIP